MPYDSFKNVSGTVLATDQGPFGAVIAAQGANKRIFLRNGVLIVKNVESGISVEILNGSGGSTIIKVLATTPVVLAFQFDGYGFPLSSNVDLWLETGIISSGRVRCTATGGVL